MISSQNKLKFFRNFDPLLLLILFVAAIARYWAINFECCRPDEEGVVRIALGFFSGDLNPHYFNWPTFYMYVVFGFYALYFMVGRLFGYYSSSVVPIEAFNSDPTNFFLITRVISAFLGTATVFIVYKIAERLFDRKTALISSLFLSLAYLHVRDSHFGVTDLRTRRIGENPGYLGRSDSSSRN
jgi:hypothetical protein